MSTRSSFKSFLLVAALTTLGAAGCSSSSSNGTEVDVEIVVDSALLPSAVSSLQGSISATGRDTVMVDLPAVSGQHWKITPQNVTQPFKALITIVGQPEGDAGALAVITARAYVWVSSGVSQGVRIELNPKCKGVSCPATQTCQAGVCVLIPEIGVDGGVPDAGTGGGAGGPAGTGGKGGSGGTPGTGGAAGAGGKPDSGGTGGGAGTGTGGTAGAGTSGTAGSGTSGTAGAGTSGTAGAGTGGTAGAGQGGTGGKAKLNPGDACTGTVDCASGVCSSVDRVCCDSDCAGTCESCVGSKTGKANGVCSPMSAGSDVDNECAPGTTTCGATGSCDGNRKCAVTAATTPCTGTSSCSGSQLTTTPAACDGKGACVPGTPALSPCPGGVTCMNATACLPSSCTMDANCTTGSYCDLGTRICTAKRNVGGTCTAGTQCTGGFCADGVCCTNACTGACEACTRAKTGATDGTCAAVTAGSDPDNECSPDATTCGRTGLCNQNGGNGSGACAFTASGTSCAGTYACSGSGVTSTTSGSCDGGGTCKQSAATAGTCAGYTCASTTACQSTCTGPSQCVSGYSCVTGMCTPSTFKTGPCVTTPNYNSAVVFAMGSDGKIHRKEASNGTTFGAWTTLSLDASGIDARSDLDCSANADVTHITATGNNPGGAFLHATGSGTTFNPFFRELTTRSFSPPGASIKAYPSGNGYVMGAVDALPSPYDVSGSGTYTSLQPITTYTTTITSVIDVSQLAAAGGATRIVVGFDSAGKLDIYNNRIDSGGARWFAPVIVSPPSGATFQYSPTVCVDTGVMSGVAVHLAAVAGGAVWDAVDPNGSGGPFSAWERVGTGAAAAVDCTMLGDGTIHIVTLNSAGHVLDMHGTPGSWTTTDLGVF